MFGEAALQAGMAVGMVDEIMVDLVDVGFWQAGGASGHAQSIVEERMRNMTSSFEGVPGVANMARGTGAGNPLADLLFNLAFWKVVSFLRREFLAAGLELSLACAGA